MRGILIRLLLTALSAAGFSVLAPRPVIRGHRVLADRPSDGRVPHLDRGAGHAGYAR